MLEARPVDCTALNSYSPLSRLNIVVSRPRAMTCNVMIPTSRLPTAHSVVTQMTITMCNIQSNRIGNDSKPRSTGVVLQRSDLAGHASCSFGIRCRRVLIAICPSSRANGAPTQK